MKNKLLLLTTFAIFLTGCAMLLPSPKKTDDIYSMFGRILLQDRDSILRMLPPGLKETNPIGKVYRDSIKLWGETYPLPDGDWFVIGRSENAFLHFRILLLKKAEAGKVHSFLLFSTQFMEDLVVAEGFYPAEEFKWNNNNYHVVVKNNEQGEAQDCWLINHFIPVGPISYEANNYLLSENISIPKIMILTFHHFTGKYILRLNKQGILQHGYLDVYYFLNPEIEGFESQNETSWDTSAWHPSRIGNDPRKKAYIERLKNEGAIMHEKIRAAFEE